METEDALDGAPEVLAAWRAAVLARAVEAGEATLRVEAERRPRPPLADPELRFAWPVLLAPAACSAARACRRSRGGGRRRRSSERGAREAARPPRHAAGAGEGAAGAGAAADARAAGCRCRRAAHRRKSAAAEPPRAKRKRASAGG